MGGWGWAQRRDGDAMRDADTLRGWTRNMEEAAGAAEEKHLLLVHYLAHATLQSKPPPPASAPPILAVHAEFRARAKPPTTTVATSPRKCFHCSSFPAAQAERQSLLDLYSSHQAPSPIKVRRATGPLRACRQQRRRASRLRPQEIQRRCTLARQDSQRC
jgi:hypothetical protein